MLVPAYNGSLVFTEGKDERLMKSQNIDAESPNDKFDHLHSSCQRSGLTLRDWTRLGFQVGQSDSPSEKKSEQAWHKLGWLSYGHPPPGPFFLLGMGQKKKWNYVILSKQYRLASQFRLNTEVWTSNKESPIKNFHDRPCGLVNGISARDM